MFPTFVRRMAERPLPFKTRSAIPRSASVPINRFKPKKVWPPDFSKLSDKQQFRFERRYKRRVRLATATPRWDKYTKLAQHITITAVLIYCLLFMETKGEQQPFQGLRNHFWGAIDAFSPEKRYERRDPELSDVSHTKR